MDKDQLFWIAFFRLITVFLVIFTVSTAGCTANTHYQVTQALLHGIDPLAVACAHDIEDNRSSCMVLAAKH